MTLTKEQMRERITGYDICGRPINPDLDYRIVNERMRMQRGYPLIEKQEEEKEKE